MNPIRSLAKFPGCIAYAIGPERWIPLITRRVLCSVRTEEKRIALTFDDGPNPEYTPLLLTKLAEYRVSATFFLIGRNLERHAEIGRRTLPIVRIHVEAYRHITHALRDFDRHEFVGRGRLGVSEERRPKQPHGATRECLEEALGGIDLKSHQRFRQIPEIWMGEGMISDVMTFGQDTL